MAVLLAAGNDVPYVAVLPILLVLGPGTGIEISSLVSLGLRLLPERDAGLASAIVNTARQVGTTLGTALIGSVYGSGGWHNFRIAVTIAIIGFVIGGVVVQIQGRPGFVRSFE